MKSSNLFADGIRLCKKDALKESVVSSDVHNTGAKPRKGDKKHQQNNSCNDGAKYMSYFKVCISETRLRL